MVAKSVIAIATGLATFIPMMSCDGMSFNECNQVLNSLKRISPKDTFTVVSGSAYEVETHARDYQW